LKDFLPIIRDSPVYPVVLDANDVVCSLPPIINSDHSKIKLTTKNVFIEVTAVKKYKIVYFSLLLEFINRLT
jgi:phenylalanyl-tRNA synthetase beta chain